MIYFLRNIAVRLWLSALTGIPMAFLLYPNVQPLLPSEQPGPITLTLIVVTFLFFLIGALMSWMGQAIIVRQVREAEKWERAGLFPRSEACYIKAMNTFDSCLISLLHSRREAIKLTGAIARFHLTFSPLNSKMEQAVLTFLHHRPDQTELSRLWIDSRFSDDPFPPPTPKEDRLITKIAEQVSSGDPQLLQRLSELFITMNRCDFAARRVFELTLETGNRCTETLREQIDDVITQSSLTISDNSSSTDNAPRSHKDQKPGDAPPSLREQLNDPHVLPNDSEFPANTLLQESDSLSFQTGCSEITDLSSSPTETTKLLDNQLGAHGTQSDAKPTQSDQPTQPTLPADSHSHNPGKGSHLKKSPPLSSNILKQISEFPNHLTRLFLKSLAFISLLLLNMISMIRKITGRSIHALLTNDRIRKTFKWACVGIIVMGLGIFITNTITHLFPPPPTAPPEPIPEETAVTEPKATPPPPTRPMRFTIQVSAYLKKNHAEEFLETVTSKGISGWISTAKGGGKTWYLIRIEKFATKADAASYGDTLKSKRLIDDYFVDNLKAHEK